MKDLLKISENLNLDANQSTVLYIVKNLWECFVQRDAKTIEINPLVLTKQGEFKAANSKVFIDNDAEYRQSELFTLYDRA